MNEKDLDFGTLDLEDIIREFGGGTSQEPAVKETADAVSEPESVNVPKKMEHEVKVSPVIEEYDSEDDEDEVEIIAPAKPKFSLFGALKRAAANLLTADDDEDDDYEEDEDEFEEEPAMAEELPAEEEPAGVEEIFEPEEELPIPEETTEEEEFEEPEEAPVEVVIAEQEEVLPVEESAEPAAEEKASSVTSDTIRLDDISQIAAEQTVVSDDTVRLDSLEQAVVVTEETVRLDRLEQVEVPAEEAEPAAEEEAEEEYDNDDEDEVEFVTRPPIVFRSKTRLGELRRQLVAGPEKRYYELTEIGVGKLQIAMLLCLVVILISGGAAMMYAAGNIAANRMRLMVFGQVLAMLCGGLLGSQQMIEGVYDVVRGRFTLNTLLGITFIACCVDSVFCLMELRVPICAAFTLEVFMSLWGTYHKRVTEMGQMDSLRKAVRLDSVVKLDEFYEGKPGFLRGEGQVDDFMNHYDEVTNPEKHQSRYAVFALLASIGVAAVAMVFHSVSMGFQILSTTLLVAVPASFFIALTRPMAVLERKLHSLGTVLCGWSGVKELCGKGVFALNDSDIFPAGSVKMNGVKFYGSRKPDETIAYAAALMRANGGTLAPIFEQLLESRGGIWYDAENLQHYGNGGIGGEICGEPVLMGTLDFLKSMGVEIPDGTQVRQAVYVSIDGDLSGLFAVTYSRMKYSASGIATLCSFRNITPVVVAEDFMLTDDFLKEKFAVNTRRMVFPERDIRAELAERQVEEGTPALALTTQEGLAPAAYAITGARTLRTASRLGLFIHIAGGLLGILIMLALAIVGSVELLTPIHVLLYQLVWMLPGLLVTLWTRTI